MPDHTEPLTPRQLQFVAHLANGLSFSEIAEVEIISSHTVKSTLDAARRRARARTLPALVARCVLDGTVANRSGNFFHNR